MTNTEIIIALNDAYDNCVFDKESIMGKKFFCAIQQLMLNDILDDIEEEENAEYVD